MRTLQSVVLALLGAAAALAQPSITAVQNAASQVPAGLPGAGIAQGAMFVIKGERLGPATVVIGTTFPLPTVMAGTSVKVTVGGRTLDCIMYYTLDRQVAAILPSATPTGTGTVTVTYNNQTSAPAPITVVANNVGIFTVSQDGNGDAIAFLNGATLLTPTAAANPGSIVVFWGTGLGPVNEDESNAAKGGDMPNVPLEVWVGGKKANVLFRGRNACCTSVDTVYVEIPQGVAGCVTPVTMRSGNLVSNTANIPVAASGSVCTPTSLAQVDVGGLARLERIAVGGVSLLHTVTVTPGISVGGITVPGSTTRNDLGAATFVRVKTTPGAVGLLSSVDVATYGSCTVVTGVAAGSSPFRGELQWLDAGASIGVSGPGGAKTLAKQSLAGTTIYSSTLDSNGAYLTAGQYTVTAPGGPDVKAFTLRLTLSPTLVWTNQEATTTVNRANGVTVNWTGGDPGGYVQISGGSAVGTSANSRASASFTCTARTSDGSFTVPPVVLLALPPSATQSAGGVSIPIPGSLSVSGYGTPVPFQAEGLDLGVASSASVSSNAVTYQ